MPLELNDDKATLTGHVDITESEALLAWLIADNSRPVDVADCPSVHMAVLQVLLATRPQLLGAEGHADWRALLGGSLETSTERDGNFHEHHSDC